MKPQVTSLPTIGPAWSDPPLVAGSARQARSLDQQALLDLAARADNGIAVHLLLWLLIGWTGHLAASAPGFFAANAAVFGLAMLLRLALRPRWAGWVNHRPGRAGCCLAALLLGSGLHWGLLAGATLLWPPLFGVRESIWLIIVGIAASGTMAFAILPPLRRLYPWVTMGPLVLLLLCTFDTSHALLPLAGLMFIAYINRTARAVQADYWDAARARAELEERARQLELLSTTDALTQVFNRHWFDQRLAEEWARAAREQQPLAVLMIDIDHFKRLNDRHGHPFGDRCLQAIAQALADALRRPTDVLARYGGEEFVALLPAASASQAALLAQGLRRTVAALALEHRGEPVALTCSVGVHAVLPARGASASAAVDAADRALYAAKAQGRNRVVVSPDSLP